MNTRKIFFMNLSYSIKKRFKDGTKSSPRQKKILVKHLIDKHFSEPKEKAAKEFEPESMPEPVLKAEPAMEPKIKETKKEKIAEKIIEQKKDEKIISSKKIQQRPLTDRRIDELEKKIDLTINTSAKQAYAESLFKKINELEKKIESENLSKKDKERLKKIVSEKKKAISELNSL